MSGIRKLLVILISAVMVLTCMPLTALAENEVATGEEVATEVVQGEEAASSDEQGAVSASEEAPAAETGSEEVKAAKSASEEVQATREVKSEEAPVAEEQAEGNLKVQNLWASLHEVGQVTFKWSKISGTTGKEWYVKYRMRKIGGNNSWSGWTEKTVADTGESQISYLVKIPTDYVIEIHVKGDGDSAWSTGIITTPAGGKYQAMQTVYVADADTNKRLDHDIIMVVGDTLKVKPDYEYSVKDYNKRPRLYPNHMLYDNSDKSVVKIKNPDGSEYTAGMIDGTATFEATKAGTTKIICRAPNGRTFILNVTVLNQGEKLVKFKIVGGKWSDGTTADKTAIVMEGSTLKASDIPEPGNEPAFGYKAEGSWDSTPTTGTPITGNTTFTYNFEPKGTRPNVPKISGLTGTAGFESVALKWNEVAVPKNGTTITYELFLRYKTYFGTSYSAWKKVYEGTDTQYTIPLNPLNGYNYQYAVRAYTTCVEDCPTGEAAGTVVTGELSDVNSKQPVHPMFISGTISANTPLYLAKSGTSSSGSLSKGYKFLGYGGQHVYKDEETKIFRLLIDMGGTANNIGTRYYVLPGKVGSRKAVYTSKDIYTTEEKEAFVNSQGIASGTNYLIWVSTYTQRVNLFTRTAKGQPWKLKATWLCNTGSSGTPTSFGQYSVSGKIRKKENGTEYMTVFNGIGLHLKLSAALGKPVSNGCVRLGRTEAVWVYDNIKKGTKVYVY